MIIDGEVRAGSVCGPLCLVVFTLCLGVGEVRRGGMLDGCWMLGQGMVAGGRTASSTASLPGVPRMMKRLSSNMHPALSGSPNWGVVCLFEDGMNRVEQERFGASLQVASSFKPGGTRGVAVVSSSCRRPGSSRRGRVTWDPLVEELCGVCGVCVMCVMCSSVA